MEIKIFTDGGSRNNPGQAAIAYLIYTDNHLYESFAQTIGINSNNFAEYTALVQALEKTKELVKSLKDVDKIIAYSDSNLMVNQVNGLFKVKNPTIREFIIKIRLLEQEIVLPVVYKYIPREENKEADKLVNRELDSLTTDY